MFNLFITHTPHGVCYLIVNDMEGNVVSKLSITPTAFFDLRERAIPEIPNDSNGKYLAHTKVDTK